MKAGILGFGGAYNMPQAHAKQLAEAGIPLAAACDLDPKRMEVAAAEFPGIATYTDPEQFLQDPSFDLAIVILPHDVHEKFAVVAAKNGKHVVVEKPMCISLAQADAMIDASTQAGKMLSIYHNRRWDGDFMKIRRFIEEGLIGEVFKIEAAMGGMHHPGTTWRAYKEKSGGILFDWGAHIIDWIFHLIPGEVAGVDGYLHKRRWMDVSNQDHGELILRFEGGQTAQVEMSSMMSSHKPRWRILGTHGSITMPDWETIEVAVDHKGHIATFKTKGDKSTPQEFYNNIAGHLLKGEELVVKPTEGRRIISVLEAAEESSNAKRTVVPRYR